MLSMVEEWKGNKTKYAKQGKCMTSGVQERKTTKGKSFITGFQSHLKSADFSVKKVL